MVVKSESQRACDAKREKSDTNVRELPEHTWSCISVLCTAQMVYWYTQTHTHTRDSKTFPAVFSLQRFATIALSGFFIHSAWDQYGERRERKLEEDSMGIPSECVQRTTQFLLVSHPAVSTLNLNQWVYQHEKAHTKYKPQTHTLHVPRSFCMLSLSAVRSSSSYM